MKIVRRVRASPHSLKIMGIIFVVSAGVVISPYFGGPSIMKGHNTANSLTASSYTSSAGVTATQKIPLSDASAQNTSDQSNPNQASSVASDRMTPRVQEPANCPALQSKLIADYTDNAKKEKDALDATLSFPVSLAISSKYVSDYNAKLTEMYNQQVATSAAEHCTLLLKAPDLLPTNYPY